MRYITPRPPVLNPLLARSGRRRHDAPLILPFFRVFINTAVLDAGPRPAPYLPTSYARASGRGLGWF